MGQSTDGTFSSASQHGAKALSLPLQSEGNFYATRVRRNMIVAPASSWAPILPTRTSYTQRLTYSDDLSNAAWTKSAATGTASAATDPEGGSTASKLAEDNTNAAHRASQAMTVAAGALAYGVLLKAAERSFARLRLNNGTDGDLAAAVFNLATGVVVSGTGAIKALLNGWYWCSVTGTATVTNSTAFIDLSSDGSTFSYTGTTGSGVYAWRATCYLAAAIGPAVQTTSATRAVTSPPVDPDDPLAFLMAESEPESSALELGVAKYFREYANVPVQIIEPASYLFTAPNLPPVSVGTLSPFQAASYTVPSGSAQRVGDYGYLALNESSQVTGYYGRLFTYTVAGSTYTVTGHNFVVGDRIIYKNGSSEVRYADVATVAGNDLTLSGDTLLGQTTSTAEKILATLLTATQTIRKRTRSTTHQGEMLTLLARRLHDFYLPGITLGVNAFTDITPQDGFNLEDFFGAYDAASTWFNVQVEALTYWPNGQGPILVQRYTQCRLADL